MAEINGRTLMMAIQAVDEKLQQLSQAIEACKEDELIDLEDMLLCYSKTADDLRKAYLLECKQCSNLPDYGKLVSTP